MRSRAVFTPLVGILLIGFAAVDASADPPSWISGPRSEDDAWRFTKRWQVDDAVEHATLKFAADFCRAVVTLNGRRVLSVDPYAPTQEIDVTFASVRGENVLDITTKSVEGPWAVALSLSLAQKNGDVMTIVTDGRWSAAPLGGNLKPVASPALDLGNVRPELWGLGRRSATISPLENYEQWRQALKTGGDPAPKFWTVPGFEVALVRKAAADEGSWIAMAFDPQGRLTISREDQGLLRMTLDAERRQVTKVEPIAVDLKECRGLLYAYDRLYVNANNSKGMYRLRIADDGRVEDLKLLREFPGNTGHGRNDLALGSDGLIYSIHGDSVLQPTENVVERTSPLRESRRGPQRSEGYLVRTDRDGKHWELLCSGLRNPYGIDVNPAGDVFTYDADNEFDMGTPWYRPTRVVQLAGGADYGYRVNGGRWPPEFVDHPDNGLPTLDIGRGSPTAVMFGTKLKFQSPYREALFILDWSYGRVVAVHLAPRGAGYRAATELFLQGKPLNVTDLAAGPDGALYLITGGRKTQSALYRVAFTGDAKPAPPPGRHEREAAEFASARRALRERLEGFHGRPNPRALAEAWPYLGDADPKLRHAARTAVEQQPPESWRSQALSSASAGDRGASTGLRAQLAAWQAVASAGDAATAASLVEQLLKVPNDGGQLGPQFELLHLYRSCLAVAPEAIDARRNDVIRQLSAMWPDPAAEGLYVGPYGTGAELRRRLAILLADLEAPGIVERICNTLLTSTVQEDRLAGLLALRNQREGWTPELRRMQFAALNDASRFVGGEGMPKFVDRLRTESLATLTPAEEKTLADVVRPPKFEDEPLPKPRPLVRKWTSDDLAELARETASVGDARRGSVIFREALCSRCHRAGLTGPAVGPDLTFVARRFSRRDMLESVLKPSAVVAEQYRNTQIETDDGKTYVGRVVAEGDFRSEKLRLNTDPLHALQFVEIDKKQIVDSRATGTSPMPEGLLDTFTKEEIADLLAFLETGGTN